MKFSPAFKWMIGVLLPLTLVWKVVVGADNPNEFTDRLVTFLAHRGFDTVTTEEVMDGMPLVRAVRGECHIFAVERSGKGWTRELLRSLEESTDQNFLVFRGTIYKHEPTWLTAASDIFFKALRRLGFGRSGLVVNVAASAACDAEGLAWDEL